MTATELAELPFTVVASCEEEGYEASKLLVFEEEGEGWQSKLDDKSDSHTLVLKVQHQDEEHIVNALEILAHENKIAQKIEILIGCGGEDNAKVKTFEECSIVQLGYITLDSNEESQYQARELKSVPLERPADFIQLVLRGCYQNPHNTDNQVGLVGIRVLGKAAVEEEELPLQEENEVVTPQRESPKMISIPSSCTTVLRSKTTPSATKTMAPSSTLPEKYRHQLDTKVQSSLSNLERMKKEAAMREDFEMAGQIKSALGNVYALLIAFKDSETQMKEAAAEEEYSLASKLKADRDSLRLQATSSLDEVQQQFIGRIDELSISTIKDESFMSQQLHSAKKTTPNKKSSFLETSSIASRTTSSSSTEEEEESSPNLSSSNASSSQGQGPRLHPLAGIDNAEELPCPEEITDASPDLVHKVEDLFQSYRTKCFFSKNWQLREAALSKMVLLLPDIFSENGDSCAETVLCSIVEMGIEDKNVQVYLESLILLDETIEQLEFLKVPQSKATPLVSRIITSLLSKLADSKSKVVDSAELALLSMANSSVIDKTSILNAACKRVRSKENKGGRTVKSRLTFLENMAAEFGQEVSWKRSVEFTKAHKSFEHKDGGVRAAARSLIVTLTAIHGNVVLDSLNDCEQVSEKLLNEFRAAVFAIKQG